MRTHPDKVMGDHLTGREDRGAATKSPRPGNEAVRPGQTRVTTARARHLFREVRPMEFSKISRTAARYAHAAAEAATPTPDSQPACQSP